MAVNSPLVSVIIPSYNGAHLLPTCLDSLRRQTFTDFETLVVDNASQDGSLDLLKGGYPEVRVIRMGANTVFAGAVNQGIRRGHGQIVALLNNDTEADPHWLEEVVAVFHAHPEVGMVASKLLLFDRRNIIHSAGDLYRADGVPGNRGVWEEDRGQYDGSLEVFGACGGAAAYRRSLLEEGGLFDEDLEGYCEDVDLSFRAQLLGYRCRFAPQARVYHRLSATGAGPRASYLCGRNFILVFVKDMPGPLLAAYWPKMVAAQLRFVAHSLGHLPEPAARARLRGQWAALRLIPRMLAKRRQIQARRRAPLSYLRSILNE